MKIAIIILMGFIYAFGDEPTKFTVGSRVPSELIVKYKDSGLDASSNMKTQSTRSFIKNSYSIKGIKTVNKLNIDHIKLSENQDLDKTMDEISSLPDVEYVEPNYILHAISIEPTQISEAQMRSILRDEWGLYNIQADLAWNTTQGDTSVVVAVIDSGVDYRHDDLKNNIWVNPRESDGNGNCVNNGRDDDGNGYIDDCHGWNFVGNNNDPDDDLDHGTHVSGIIGGSGASRIFGVALIVKIMAVKFIDSDGYGTTADAIKGIMYAVNNGAKILNNSWGGADYSSSLKQAIEYSRDHNTLFVAASGNDGINNDSIQHYPSSYAVENILAVGASNEYNGLTSFSNYGADSVDVVAPGEYIYSTITNNDYYSFSGTSMAAPFVSGIAALVYAKHPTFSGVYLKRAVMESADSFSNLRGVTLTSGRVNASQALSLASAGLPATPRYPMLPQGTDPNEVQKKVSSSKSKGGFFGCGFVETNEPPNNFMNILILLLPVLIPAIMIKTRKTVRIFVRTKK